MISETDLDNAILAYWGNRENQTQRLGQYLMNNLLPDKVCPSIYYCEDPKRAYNLFLETFTWTS